MHPAFLFPLLLPLLLSATPRPQQSQPQHPSTTPIVVPINPITNLPDIPRPYSPLCKDYCYPGQRLQFCECVSDPCNLDHCVAPYLKNYKYCACVMPGDDVEKCIKKCNNGERFNLRYCGCVPVYTNICSQVYCPNRSERPDYSTCSCVSKATPVGLCTPCRAGMTQDKYCNCIPIPNPNKLT